MAKRPTIKGKKRRKKKGTRPSKAARSVVDGSTWKVTRWLVLRLIAVYILFNLGLNLVLSASQPLRPLRLLTLSRIDERLDAAGMLLRHHFPTHSCETNLNPDEIKELARGIAQYHGIDPALLLALVETESNFVTHAVSPVGAMGLAQLMPSTAVWMKVDDPFNPRDNLDGAARYLKKLIEQFDGDIDLALAAYNAGPGTVRRHKGVPPWPETVGYIKKVNQRRERYSGAEVAREP